MSLAKKNQLYSSVFQLDTTPHSSLHGLERIFCKKPGKNYFYILFGCLSPLGTVRSLRSCSPSPPWTVRRRPPGPAGASGSTLCTRVHKRQFAMCIEGSTIQVLYTVCVQHKDFFKKMVKICLQMFCYRNFTASYFYYSGFAASLSQLLWRQR